LVLIVSLSGFASGMTMPSRDMIVRSVTPPGSFGKVFRLRDHRLSHIGGMVAPLIFAQLLDHGHPGAVFLYIAPAPSSPSPLLHSACRADARLETVAGGALAASCAFPLLVE